MAGPLDLFGGSVQVAGDLNVTGSVIGSSVTATDVDSLLQDALDLRYASADSISSAALRATLDAGEANGIATLDVNGLLAEAQLPLSVMDLRYTRNDGRSFVRLTMQGLGQDPNTASCNAAVQFLISLGARKIYFEPGTFRIDYTSESGIEVRVPNIDIGGAGKHLTKFIPMPGTGIGHGFNIDNAAAYNVTLHDFEIDGGWAPPWVDEAGHGIRASTTVPVVGVHIHDVIIRNFPSYGVGFQGNSVTNTTVERVDIYNVGQDGLDIKNANNTAGSLVLDKIRVDGFGLSSADSSGNAGIDIRGQVTATNLWIKGYHTTAASSEINGIRIRFGEEGDANGQGGHLSSVSQFYVTGCDNGIQDYGHDTAWSNGTCEGNKNGGNFSDPNNALYQGLTAGKYVSASGVRFINNEVDGLLVDGSEQISHLFGCDFRGNGRYGIRAGTSGAKAILFGGFVANNSDDGANAVAGSTIEYFLTEFASNAGGNFGGTGTFVNRATGGGGTAEWTPIIRRSDIATPAIGSSFTPISTHGSAGAVSVNRLSVYPIAFHDDVTIDLFAVGVAVAATVASVARFGVYAADAEGGPGVKLYETPGTQNLQTLGAGGTAASFTFDAETQYWVGVAVQTGITSLTLMRAQGAPYDLPRISMDEALTPACAVYFTGVSGTLPADLSSNTLVGTANLPMIGMRRSA